VEDIAAVPARPPAWFLSPSEALERFAALYGIAESAGSAPCAAGRPRALVCQRESEARLDAVLAGERPVLLALRDARGFEGRAVLLGHDGDAVLLLGARGALRVSVEDLASAWTGELWTYWRRPTTVTRTLARGDRGADVRWVAALFARLDGRDRPLADDFFNARLEERIRLFQRSWDLEPDGVIGENTLRALVLAAGEDLSRADARRLAGRGSGSATP
jgi:general secretion pathway protein A